jgi:flagellar hook-associated protein 3 FlgL
MTRVTQLSMSNASLAGLQASLATVQNLQAQASSGKRIQVPSDDPQGTSISMQLRSQQAADTQYGRNSDFANARLGVVDTALQAMSAQLIAARSLVVSSQDGQRSSSSRAALSSQITQIKDQMTALYNSQYLGRPVFGGTSRSGATLDSSNTYVGDGNPVMVQLSATTTVRVDVDGASIGADKVPALMDQLATNAAAAGGSPQSDLNDLDAVLAQVSTAIGNVGAAETRVTTTSGLVSASSADLTTTISHNEEADLAEVLTKFASQQIAYQTALGVAAKINQTSLLDFLR